MTSTASRPSSRRSSSISTAAVLWCPRRVRRLRRRRPAERSARRASRGADCSPADASTCLSCAASARRRTSTRAASASATTTRQPERDFGLDACFVRDREVGPCEFHRVTFDLDEVDAVTRAAASRRRSFDRYGAPSRAALRLAASGNCYKVRLLLPSSAFPYERHESTRATATVRDEMLGGKNPALRVPVLQLDDGRHLAESNAILWYLADDTPYLPSDRFDRASVLQWMFFEQYDHEPYVAVVRHRTLHGPVARLPGLGRAARARRRGARGDGRASRRARVLRRGRATRSPTSRSTRTRTWRARAASTSRATRRSAPGSTASPPSRATSRSTASRRWKPSASLSFAASSWHTRGTRRARGRHVPRTSPRDRAAVRRPARLHLDRRPRPQADAHVAARLVQAAARFRGCSARDGSSSTGRTRRACCPSTTTRSSSGAWCTSRMRTGGAGSDKTARRRSTCSRRFASAAHCPRVPSRDGASPGEMWSWKPAKGALEHLFAAGELVVAGRNGFQRVYDLPERVIPREYLDAPTPSEDEFRRGYALRAVQGRGALTERGIAEHCRFRGGAKGMRPIVDGLVDDGLVRRVAVEDGGPPVVVAADVVRRRRGVARRRAPLPVRQPALGQAVRGARLRLPAADRGLQARARADLRLLRPSLPARRPLRRSRRPQGRPRRGRPPRQGLPCRARRPCVEAARRGVRSCARAARAGLGLERVDR